MEARRIHKNHYIATRMNYLSPTSEYFDRSDANTNYSDYVDNSSEYSRNNVSRVREVPKPHKLHSDYNNSDIYVRNDTYEPSSEISGTKYYRNIDPSHYSYQSRDAPSVASSIKTKTSRKGQLTLEAMSAPNPLCPNIRGMCCFMLLLNLAIILICIGFVIVIQFIQPFFVWISGLTFVIFGIITLIGSLIYCVTICRQTQHDQNLYNDDLYWTHHWQKTFNTPEIHTKSNDKYDQYSASKYSDSGRY